MVLDSVTAWAASGARVGAHSGAALSGAGLGRLGTLGAVWERVGLDRDGQRDRGGQCARLDSETG